MIVYKIYYFKYTFFSPINLHSFVLFKKSFIFRFVPDWCLDSSLSWKAAKYTHSFGKTSVHGAVPFVE